MRIYLTTLLRAICAVFLLAQIAQASDAPMLQTAMALAGNRQCG